MVEEKQKHDEGYCRMCKKERVFISTLSPKGYWVCCTCGNKQRNVEAYKTKEWV